MLHRRNLSLDKYCMEASCWCSKLHRRDLSLDKYCMEALYWCPMLRTRDLPLHKYCVQASCRCPMLRISSLLKGNCAYCSLSLFFNGAHQCFAADVCDLLPNQASLTRLHSWLLDACWGLPAAVGWAECEPGVRQSACPEAQLIMCSIVDKHATKSATHDAATSVQAALQCGDARLLITRCAGQCWLQDFASRGVRGWVGGC